MLSLWFRALAKYLVGGLLFVCLMLSLALWVEKRHAHKLQDQVVSLSAELKRISAERDNQKRETSERIKVVERVIRDADGRAKVVESAPPAPECRTKPEVLQADL
jgi:hypothetical protein